MSVILSKNFSVNSISFSKPAVLKSGAKQAYVNYNGGKLLMQTPPKFALPFGVSAFEDKTKPQNAPVYSLDLSFREKDTNAAVKTFYDAMMELDNLMMETAVSKSEEWFGKKKSREVLEELYTPVVKKAKDDKYPPTMKLKLSQRDGAFDAKFYDEARNEYKDFDIKELLPRNSTVTCIIQCAGVWFAGGKFGLTWRAVQVMINSKPQELPSFGFAEDEGLELSDAAVPAPSVVAAMMPSKPSAPTPIEDNTVDDDEAFAEPPPVKKHISVAPPAPESVADEDDEEMEPAPVPKKPMIKKKVTVAAKK